MRLTHALAMLW